MGAALIFMADTSKNATISRPFSQDRTYKLVKLCGLWTSPSFWKKKIIAMIWCVCMYPKHSAAVEQTNFSPIETNDKHNLLCVKKILYPEEGHKNYVTSIDKLLLTVTRLHLGLLEKDLAERFNIAQQKMSGIFVTCMDWWHTSDCIGQVSFSTAQET